MHIIVDGYNILKQILKTDYVPENKRRAFINLLGKYASKKNHTALVVFDGGPGPWQTKEKDHGITILYSGTHQDADAVIKSYISTTPTTLLVVSSDNELKKYAHQFKKIVMDSADFYNLLKSPPSSPSGPLNSTSLIKTTSSQNVLVDELMQQDNQKIQKEEPEYSYSRKSPGHTSSKKERQYWQKIKKI